MIKKIQYKKKSNENVFFITFDYLESINVLNSFGKIWLMDRLRLFIHLFSFLRFLSVGNFNEGQLYNI